MKRKRSGRRLLSLLCGAALAACPGSVRPAPADAPPTGFVWEEMKNIHAWILRPEKWFVRSGVGGAPPFKNAQGGTGGGRPYEFSSQPFVGWTLLEGVWISADPHVTATFGKSAEDMAADLQKEMVGESDVLDRSRKSGSPSESYTTFVVVFKGSKQEPDYTFKSVAIVNHATDTVYFCTVRTPTDRWKDLEPLGDKMLASLRLDPKF